MTSGKPPAIILKTSTKLYVIAEIILIFENLWGSKYDIEIIRLIEHKIQ